MPTPDVIQMATLLAMSVPDLTPAQLTESGYKVGGKDGASPFALNRAIRAQRVLTMLRESDPEHGAIGRAVNCGIPKKEDGVHNEVKVAPNLILLGAEAVLNKNTNEPTGRLRILFRSTVTEKRKDGIEKAQTPFGNTAEGQVLINKAISMKGHLVTAFIEMEPMQNSSDSEKVRTLRDLTSRGPVRMVDVTRLGATAEWLAQYKVTPIAD